MNAFQPDESRAEQLSVDHDRPAIGIAGSEDDRDAIARIVLRANQKGYPVLVAYSGSLSDQTTSFLGSLDAIIVESDIQNSDKNSIVQTLSSVARRNGFPGLIFHDQLDEEIDYGRSVTMLEKAEAYSIETEPQPYDSRLQTLVAIPAYNEADTIGAVVEQARHHVDKVLVVNDGSNDDTARRANEAGAIVLEHDKNRGYGASLMTAFREANRRGVDHLVVLDGDGQHDPTEIPRLIEAQRQTNGEIVIGSRFLGGENVELPFYRKVGLDVVNILTNVGLGRDRRHHVRDTQSGFRAYNRQAIRTLSEDDQIGNRMDASLDILYHAQRHDYRIEEVDASIRYDVEDASSHNPIVHGVMLMKKAVQAAGYRRPILVLGIPGFAGALTGLVTIQLITFNFVLDTLTFSFMAVLSSGLFLLGLMACFLMVSLQSERFQAQYQE